MELWGWIIIAAVAAGALFFGVFLGRSGTDAAVYQNKVKELESELNTVKNEYSGYRDDVTDHFRTTAELVNQMTSSYRAVYGHLATGSEKLCTSEIALEHLSEPREALPKSSSEDKASSGEDAASAKKSETPAAAPATGNGPDTTAEQDAPAVAAASDRGSEKTASTEAPTYH